MCMFSVFQCNLPTLTHTNNNVQHTACNMQHATCTLRFIDFRETMRCCFGSLLLPILFFLISVGYWWSPFISLLHYFDAPLSNMKISAVCTFFFFQFFVVEICMHLCCSAGEWGTAIKLSHTDTIYLATLCFRRRWWMCCASVVVDFRCYCGNVWKL